MTKAIAPVINGNTFVDANGKVLRGEVWTYTAGSFSVPREAFVDELGDVPAPNPIPLNTGGRLSVNIYLSYNEAYNLVVRGPDGEVFTYVDDVVIYLPEV